MIVLCIVPGKVAVKILNSIIEIQKAPQRNIRNWGLSLAIQASEEDLILFAQISGLTISILFDIASEWSDLK